MKISKPNENIKANPMFQDERFSDPVFLALLFFLFDEFSAFGFIFTFLEDARKSDSSGGRGERERGGGAEHQRNTMAA